MEHRTLGASGLRVSALTLGTMTFGGSGQFAPVGNTDLETARRQIDMCLDAGVTLFDTADVYSEGQSEEILGRALEGRRDDVLVATKARFPMGPGQNDAGLSRHHLIRACEASLRRLGTDWIDLYQVHEWDGETAARGDARRPAAPRRPGQGPLRRLLELHGLADGQGARDRRPARAAALRQHAGVLLAAGALHRDGGPARLPGRRRRRARLEPAGRRLLSGKYRRGQAGPEGSRHLTEWSEPPVHDEDRLYDTIDLLVEIGEGHGVSAAQVALAWLLRRPGISSLVIGARTDEQLADNLAAAQLELSDDEVRRLDDVSRPPLPYPLWHQVASASERLGPADRAYLGPHLP
jgi:aryl-alcohol dehydrogenase-like predicted oxidoreductase